MKKHAKRASTFTPVLQPPCELLTPFLKRTILRQSSLKHSCPSSHDTLHSRHLNLSVQLQIWCSSDSATRQEEVPWAWVFRDRVLAPRPLTLCCMTWESQASGSSSLK